MAVDVANFIARNFNAPDRAEVDRAKYGNALMRNEVARLPQANQAQDLEIQARQQALSDSQKQNARGVLARNLSAIAQSPQPKIAAQQFISSPDFQAAGKLLGLPIDQFTVTDQDTDEVIRSGAMDWARALGGETTTGDQPSKVQEYEYARKNGFSGSYSDFLDKFYGREVNEPANVKAARYYEGLSPEQRTRYVEANRNMPVETVASVPTRVGPGGALQPLSTLENEADAKRRLAAAQASGTAAGELASPMKSVRIEAATRRLQRVKEASDALQGGNPITGYLKGFTQAGQELNQANSQLMTELTAITRIPGVGSQSDLEQRLAQLQLPTPEMYPAVRAKAIAELEAFMRDLDAALSKAGAGGQSTPQGAQQIDVTKLSDDELRAIINGK